eukprot:TRINITY_DN5347_c0_g1_i2.p1 TRINITY_DN5347_c0_g1~~TRINITY_DN5347_c0_g1_i2.p1  ORF type:complete len:417 (+),score=66.89 TRINITY_DN5347_c0_g1_i2:146-1396(+)
MDPERQQDSSASSASNKSQNNQLFKCKTKYLWIFLVIVSTSLVGYMFGLRSSSSVKGALYRVPHDFANYNFTEDSTKNSGHKNVIGDSWEVLDNHKEQEKQGEIQKDTQKEKETQKEEEKEIEIVKEKPKVFRAVINRFKENLEWIKGLDKDIEITVMNKGEPLEKNILELRPDLEEVKRPNLGRECDGFLTYIVEYYDKLADVTVFLHGDPPGQYHSVENVLQHINDHKKRFFAGEDIPHYKSFNRVITFRCMDEQVDFCCRLSRKSVNILWHRFWPDETGMPPNAPACVGGECCAQFAVKRGAVHKHKWEAFRDTLFWIQENGQDYYACYDIEHFWQILFGIKPILYGIPEDVLNQKFDIAKRLIEEWPFQRCEIDEWKQKKDAGQNTPIYPHGHVPCHDVPYNNRTFEEITRV